MATSFIGGRSRSTRSEPPTMGRQLVNFITCGCESSVLCTQCCQCPLIIHSWLTIRDYPFVIDPSLYSWLTLRFIRDWPFGLFVTDLRFIRDWPSVYSWLTLRFIRDWPFGLFVIDPSVYSWLTLRFIRDWQFKTLQEHSNYIRFIKFDTQCFDWIIVTYYYCLIICACAYGTPNYCVFMYKYITFIYVLEKVKRWRSTIPSNTSV